MSTVTVGDVRAEHIRALLVAGDFEAASRAAEQAVASGTLSPADQAQVLLDWVRASTAIDHMEDAQERLSEALGLTPDAAAETLAQEIRLELARVFIMQGNLRQGLDLSQKVEEEAAQRGWAYVEARASAICGWACMRMRRFNDAVEALTPAREFYQAHPEHYGALQCEHWYAWSLIGAGRIEEGLAIAEAQLAQLESGPANPYTLSTVLNALTYGEFCRGNLRRVAELAQGKLDAETQIGSKPRIQVMLYNMALLAIQMGDFASARERLLRCWALSQELPDQRFSVELAKLLAIVAIHAGEPEEALQYTLLGQQQLRSSGVEAEQTYDWYLALALLASGYCDQAKASWLNRKPYETTHENWLELQLLRAALDRIAEPDYPRLNASTAEVQEVWQAWLEQLLAEQRCMPRPPAVESGLLYGEIEPAS